MTTNKLLSPALTGAAHSRRASLGYEEWPEGDRTAAAELVYQRDSQWYAPYLWRSEYRNILATYLRSQAISLSEAVDLAIIAENLLKGREFQVDFFAVLMLAAKTGLSAYDCEFVVLASELNAPLVTSDRQILKLGAEINAIAPEDFLSKR